RRAVALRVRDPLLAISCRAHCMRHWVVFVYVLQDGLFSFFALFRPPPRSTLFPYMTLFRSQNYRVIVFAQNHAVLVSEFVRKILDRKSTRLNSSHVSISYALFCLKKKMCTLLRDCTITAVAAAVGGPRHGAVLSLDSGASMI